MKRTTIGLGAILATALSFGIAAAQPEGAWHGHGGSPGLEFLHSLNLTDQQKTDIHQIEKSAWEQAKPLMQKMRAAHEAEINALLGSGTVTADSLQPTMAQESALRQQLETIHLNTMIQVRGVLTAEQLAQAASKHAQIEQLHEQEHALMDSAQ